MKIYKKGSREEFTCLGFAGYDLVIEATNEVGFEIVSGFGFETEDGYGINQANLSEHAGAIRLKKEAAAKKREIVAAQQAKRDKISEAAKVEAEKKAAAEAKTKEIRENAWNLEFYKFGNGRSARAVPNEDFWADWKANSAEIKNLGFWVEKGVRFMVYARVDSQVDILDVGLEKQVPVDFKKEKQEIEKEVLRDDLEDGVFNTGAANDLRSESPDAYERRRDFEEDGYGDRY